MRADDTNGIDAGMGVVPLIFDGQHRFDHRATAAQTSGTCRRLTRAWMSAVSIGASMVTREIGCLPTDNASMRLPPAVG